MPLLAELFRGTGSVGKVAARKGWRVFSVDIDPASGATYTGDIRDFPYAPRARAGFCVGEPAVHHLLVRRELGAQTEFGGHERRRQGRRRHPPAHAAHHSLLGEAEPEAQGVHRESARTHAQHARDETVSLRTTTYYSQYGWPIHKPTDFFTNFPLRLRPAEAPAGVETVAVGKGPGWRAAIRDAFGPSAAGQSQATLLGRIPPTLVRDILRQMEEAKKAA